MLANTNYVAWCEDSLVTRRLLPDGTIHSQRKRLPNNTSQFDRNVQKAYLKGMVNAVKYVRDTKAMSLSDGPKWGLRECIRHVRRLRGCDDFPIWKEYYWANEVRKKWREDAIL